MPLHSPDGEFAGDFARMPVVDEINNDDDLRKGIKCIDLMTVELNKRHQEEVKVIMSDIDELKQREEELKNDINKGYLPLVITGHLMEVAEVEYYLNTRDIQSDAVSCGFPLLAYLILNIWAATIGPIFEISCQCH